LNLVQEEGMAEIEKLFQGVIESFETEEGKAGFLNNF